MAFNQGPADNYLRQIVIKEGFPEYCEEEAASLNYPNWSLPSCHPTQTEALYNRVPL